MKRNLRKIYNGVRKIIAGAYSVMYNNSISTKNAGEEDTMLTAIVEISVSRVPIPLPRLADRIKCELLGESRVRISAFTDEFDEVAQKLSRSFGDMCVLKGQENGLGRAISERVPREA